jgi:hypothetical protein
MTFDWRTRPARFPCGHVLDDEVGLDVVLGSPVLLGAVVGGGVEGATLGSIVGAELGEGYHARIDCRCRVKR